MTATKDLKDFEKEMKDAREQEEKERATWTIDQVISKIRKDLQRAEIGKSGKNGHQKFEYFELSDFLPTVNDLNEKYGANDVISVSDTMTGSKEITLTYYYKDQFRTYSLPFIVFETPAYNGKKSMQDIQYFGAMVTYYKRYLYLMALGITDGDVIDGMDNSQLPVEDKKPPKTQGKTQGKTKGATPPKKERKELPENDRIEQVKPLLSKIAGYKDSRRNQAVKKLYQDFKMFNENTNKLEYNAVTFLADDRFTSFFNQLTAISTEDEK